MNTGERLEPDAYQNVATFSDATRDVAVQVRKMSVHAIMGISTREAQIH